MNKKTYRGVIFDLDGTLLDPSEGVFASVRHTVEALGKPALDEATLRKRWKISLRLRNSPNFFPMLWKS